MSDKLLFIVNPNAGKRKGEKDWKTIESLLIQNEIPFEVVFTRYKFQAVELTQKYIEKGFRTIIAVGGDGNLNEVINGIFTQNKIPTTEFAVGMIPIGTGNDWGRTYNIPTDYFQILRVIKTKKKVLQDIGKVWYHQDGSKASRYFINMAGMGFDAQVANLTNKQKELGKGNAFSYLLNIFTVLWKHQAKNARFSFNETSFNELVFSMTVAICNYSGGGMMQAPKARPDDGLFDLTIIKDVGKMFVIKNISKLYDGSFIELPQVETFTSNYIEIESQFPITLEVDGESLGHTPFQFKIIPKSINVIIP